MPDSRTIAVVGGGPAGSMAAERLMRGQGGARVVIFEEKPDWEKPCGGGLSHKALKVYPFLSRADGIANPLWKMEMRAPGGATVCINLREPLVVYSRSALDHLLLQRSQQAGASVVRDRIVNVDRMGDKWRLKGRAASYDADYLILAAGARSPLRNKLAGALKAQDFMLTYGYYVPVREDVLRVGFFEDFEGYAWSFPRSDHLSVGICGKVGRTQMAEMRQKLSAFMADYGYSAASGRVFSHLLPSLDAESWKNLRLEGSGWAMVGDVAGLADPITGEGLYSALRSGEMLAASMTDGFSYTRSVWNELGSKLMLAARMGPKFYRGGFLGAGVTTRMIQLCKRSKTFLDLFQDVVEGSQSYSGIPKRVFRSLPKSLWEIASQSVEKRIGIHSAERV